MFIPWATVCLTALLSTAAPQPAPPELKKLGELAIRLRIPLPPKDARLILAHTERWHQLHVPPTGGDPGLYAPAFLLEEKPDKSIVILLGTERRAVAYRREEPLWRKFSLDCVKGTPWGYETSFDDKSTFVCAAQLAARGHFDTARGLLKRFTEDNPDRLKGDPSLLAECAYDYQRNRLLQGRMYWRDVHTRMTALFDEFPDLKTEKQRGLLTDLTATLNAKPPKPGSVEALLLDWASRPRDEAWHGLAYDEPDRASAPAWEIILRGFDSVPGLIALLGDKRVTAHRDPLTLDVDRLGSLADVLLCSIAGAPIETYTEDQFWQRHTPAQWRKWWETNRGIKEQDYLAGAVFEVKGQRITYVYDKVARIIAHKYPELLAGLCEDYSRRASPEAYPTSLAGAVVAAERLPKDKRIKLLGEFAGRGTLADRLIVLGALAELDQKECVRLLLPILEKMPRAAARRSASDPEVIAAYPVSMVEDVRVWKEYLRVALKADVGLRLEMLDHFSAYSASVPKRNRGLRLAVLAAFLNDRTVRDKSINPEKFADVSAGFLFDRIAVRDFAAMTIAEILGLGAHPDRHWDEIEWAKLRNAVRRRLADETLPDLGP